MSYYDNQEAKVKISIELEKKGWKIYGFREDQSDSMTDYWSPASWSGICSKNGYVLVIDQNSTHYSGYEVKKYDYSKQKSQYKSNARIDKLTAMMNDPASTENEKASCAVLIEKEQEKLGIDTKPSYTIIETYPTFQYGNPKACNWHIEFNGQIIAKGKGAFAVNSYDWEDKTKTAAEQKAEKLSAFINRIESAISQADALEAEVIKVAKTSIKAVEMDIKTITENMISENTHIKMVVSYTHGNYKGNVWKMVRKYEGQSTSFIFQRLGKRGKPVNGDWWLSVEKINTMLSKGHIAIVEMQEVTEYEEKTVYKKTAKKQPKPNFDNVAISGDVQEPTEQPKQEKATNTTTSQEQATSKQLFALYCATKLDTRNLNITKEKASELIGKSKNGQSIVDELKELLGLNVEVKKEENQEQSITESDISSSELEEVTDIIFEVSADILTGNWTHDPIHPVTEEEITSYRNKLAESIKNKNITITLQVIECIKSKVSNTLIVEALEQFRVSQNSHNSSSKKLQDKIDYDSIITKIDKQIESNQSKLDSLSGNYLTNTWKRQQEEASREMKRETLRNDIALLEYLRDKALNKDMTQLEQNLIVGAFREQIRLYSIQKNEYQYPEIDYRYPLDGWWNQEAPKKQKRLKKANIHNYYDLKKAVDEFREIRSEIIKPKNPITQRIKKLESEVKLRKIDGYFPTPKAIVQRMIDLADIRDGEKILEPSAGNGNILDGITEYLQNNSITASLEGIECNFTLKEILELKQYKVVSDDFMEYAKYGYYDKIILNPPFEKSKDVDHVLHAYKHLKEGGRIVAIMSPHWTFASDSKSVSFRDWLDSRGYYEKLAEGSFKESGTGVNTVIVVIDKLEETAAEAI